jgi:hypothetical protein
VPGCTWQCRQSKALPVIVTVYCTTYTSKKLVANVAFCKKLFLCNFCPEKGLFIEQLHCLAPVEIAFPIDDRLQPLWQGVHEFHPVLPHPDVYDFCSSTVG